MRTAWGRARGVALFAVLVGAVALTWRWGAADRAAALGVRPTLADLIAGVAAVVLPLVLVWLALLVVLVVAEPIVGRELTGVAGCPPALRRLLLTLVGAAVAGALVVPAQASAPRGDGAPGGSQGAARAQTVPGLLDGLPLPERPVGAAPEEPAPAARAAALARPAAASNEGTSIIVRPGDSLWRLVEQRLRGATDRQLAEAVARLYAANRDRIGDDPDLILPGTILRPAPGSVPGPVPGSPSGADDPQEEPS